LSACLVVQDFDRMADWYARIFGVKLEEAENFRDYGARIGYFRAPSFVLELMETKVFNGLRRANPPFHGAIQGVSQLTLRIDKIESALADMREAGVEIAMDLVDVADLRVKAFFVRDPEGNLVELLEFY